MTPARPLILVLVNLAMIVALAAPTLAQTDSTVEGAALADEGLAGEAAAPGFAEGDQPDVVVLNRAEAKPAVVASLDARLDESIADSRG